MVVDSSAVITILQGEPESLGLLQALSTGYPRLMSAVTMLETSIVVEARHGSPGILELDRFLETAAIEWVEFDLAQSLIAREAYRVFGKGRHPAALNFGDCCTYALARTRNEPILFKGDDFSRTDIGTLP